MVACEPRSPAWCSRVACCSPLRLPACAAADGHTCCPTRVNRRPDCTPLAASRQELHRLRSACISSLSFRIRELKSAQMRPSLLCADKFVEDIEHRAHQHQQDQKVARRRAAHPLLFSLASRRCARPSHVLTHATRAFRRTAHTLLSLSLCPRSAAAMN